MLPSTHIKASHYRLTSETPLKWLFAGGPIEARYCMLTGFHLRILTFNNWERETLNGYFYKDEMPHNAVFNQCLQSLLRKKDLQTKKLYF